MANKQILTRLTDLSKEHDELEEQYRNWQQAKSFHCQSRHQQIDLSKRSANSGEYHYNGDILHTSTKYLDFEVTKALAMAFITKEIERVEKEIEEL